MKIGIITLYNNSKNYGGLLQSYALATFLNDRDNMDAKQITYDIYSDDNEINTSIYDDNSVLKRLLKTPIHKFPAKIYRRIKNTNNAPLVTSDELRQTFTTRIGKCKKFEKFIPHTAENTYNDKTISQLNGDFDAFITGSDQVWNPAWFRTSLFLDFADKDKLKISYAASMAVNELSPNQSKVMMPLIHRFDGVSVREKTAKKIINSYEDIPVSVVSDPVLLLDSDDWDKVATSPLKGKDYAYSYLLGDSQNNRDICTMAAQKLNVPMATVPYIHFEYNPWDSNYGDIQMPDLGPTDFVGIIRDSKLVLTDSFHAVVFSIIYKRNFIAVKRHNDTKANSMNTRITDLLDEMGLSDRIVDNLDVLTDEFLAKDIDYTYAHQQILSKKVSSLAFLSDAFKGTHVAETFTQMKKDITNEN